MVGPADLAGVLRQDGVHHAPEPAGSSHPGPWPEPEDAAGRAQPEAATVRLSVTVRLFTTDGVPVSPPVAYRRADSTSMPS